MLGYYVKPFSIFSGLVDFSAPAPAPALHIFSPSRDPGRTRVPGRTLSTLTVDHDPGRTLSTLTVDPDPGPTLSTLTVRDRP